MGLISVELSYHKVERLEEINVLELSRVGFLLIVIRGVPVNYSSKEGEPVEWTEGEGWGSGIGGWCSRCQAENAWPKRCGRRFDNVACLGFVA